MPETPTSSANSDSKTFFNAALAPNNTFVKMNDNL